MNLFKTLLGILIYHAIRGNGNDINLDDSVQFKISWPGDSNSQNEIPGQNLVIKTSDNEEFSCLIPNIEKGISVKEENKYKGPNPIELLHPLFLLMTCSYMLESYWTYELCHGRYLRQFHDDGGSSKVQEYFLGNWDGEKFKESVTNYDAHLLEDTNYVSSRKKVNGQFVSTVMINMTDGSLCDINNEKRHTRVHYVCHKSGKHEIYSLEEVSTCEYEVIVLSPYLCIHPNFKVKEQIVNEILCHPLNGAPQKPKALQLEEKASENILYFQNGNFPEIEVPAVEISPLPVPKKDFSAPIFDEKLVQSFLSGEYCLHGGSGWWKYEFCYGREILQYHEENSQRITTLKLGMFKKDAHLQWIAKNPQKKPRFDKKITQVSHFYSAGDFCDATKKNREVEVKMKCKEDLNPNAVSLYLLEPTTCEYILGVESSIICSLLNHIDDYGLIEKMYESSIEEPVVVKDKVKKEEL